jgi:uncharacterized protein (TIGR02246 family)
VLKNPQFYFKSHSPRKVYKKIVGNQIICFKFALEIKIVEIWANANYNLRPNKLEEVSMKVLQAPLVLIALVLIACQPAGPAALPETDMKAIEEISMTFQEGMNANDWAAVAATYTKDAVLLPPNSPAVSGRENIEAYFSKFPPISDAELINVEVKGQGDWAWVRGTYKMIISPPEMEPITDTGKYIEIRKKQSDGSWLIYRDIYNSDMQVPQ